MIEGNKNNNPRSGAFEVHINDVLVFSKFDCGHFPDEKHVKEWFNNL